jgi:hypothetical protein
MNRQKRQLKLSVGPRNLESTGGSGAGGGASVDPSGVTH